MTRFYFDTEFDEDSETVELISIGVVCEDSAEYYAASRQFDPLHCSQWAWDHVLSQLPPPGDDLWKSKAQIREELLAFVKEHSVTNPEFWAYYADYDWVVLCQLFGRMVDLPGGFPKYCLDIKQEMHRFGILSRDLPDQPEGTEHNALDAARWNKTVHAWIEKNYERSSK